MKKSKSLVHNFLNGLNKTEKRSSNIHSSISKKTPGFNEGYSFFHRGCKRLNSLPSKKKEIVNKFQNFNKVNKSQEISLKYIKDSKDRSDVNVNCTNINISIVNPNFSINNFEGRNSVSNLTNNKLAVNFINNSLLSFNDNFDKIELNENDSKTKLDNNKTKIIASIYKDYIENKSNDETFPDNFGDELKKNKFKKYVNKNKIVQHEYKSKGIIAGFSAYTYPNEDIINRDKICLNINIDKQNIYLKENDNREIVVNNHIINYFSLFCGGKNDKNDELPKMLKNRLKDIILNDKNLIKNPELTIKNGLFNCEVDYINYFIEEKNKKTFNFRSSEKSEKIPHCSILIILNIDNVFYVASIGKIISILSSNYSKKINYLSNINIKNSKNNEKKENNINSFFNDNYSFSEDIKKENEYINQEPTSKNNILLEKNNLDILNNNISNQISNKSKVIRIFPGDTLNKILGNKEKESKNFINPISSNKLIKRRASTTTIDIFNNLRIQKSKNLKLNNLMKEINKKLKVKSSNSSRHLPEVQTKKINNINININSNEPIEKARLSYPDILSYKYSKNHDFILICNKKLFEIFGYDKMCKEVYETMKKCIKKKRSFEIFLGCVVKNLIKKTISLGITTNISFLFICFDSIKNLYLKENINLIENELVSVCLTSNNNKKFELYDNLLSSDIIDMEKSLNYEKAIKNQIDKLNKAKKEESPNIIKNNPTQVLYNNYFNSSKNNIILEKEKKKRNKCCC